MKEAHRIFFFKWDVLDIFLVKTEVGDRSEAFLNTAVL